MPKKIKYVSFGDLDQLDQEISREPSPATHKPGDMGNKSYPQDHLLPTKETPVVTHKESFSVTHKAEDVGNKFTQKVATHTTGGSATHKKKDRHSGEKIQLGIRQSAPIVKEAKEFCLKNGLKLQDLYELAVTHYIDFVGSHKLQEVGSSSSDQVGNRTSIDMGSMLSHDDLKIIYKTNDNIIMLFEQMTGRKWTAADDREGARYNSIDPRVLEIGMITTRLQSRRLQINSFRYFVPEIEGKIQEIRESNLSDQALNVGLRRLKEKLAKWQEEHKKK